MAEERRGKVAEDAGKDSEVVPMRVVFGKLQRHKKRDKFFLILTLARKWTF
jgi:hypothetical protein